MKKLIICSVLTTLLVGCHQGMDKTAKVDVTAPLVASLEHTTNQTRLPDLLNQCNTIIQKNNLEEAKAFLDTQMPTASTLDADIMVAMYVDQQRLFLEGYSEVLFDWSYQNALLDAYDKSFNLDKLSGTYKKEVMAFLENVKRNGFLLNYHEGIVTIYPDYNLLKSYEQYVSDSIQDYIEILSRESSEILSADGGLTITWEELSFRVLNAERYLVNHNDSIRYDEIFEMYKWYLNTLLTGLPDTPIYYRNSNLIRNDVLQTYNKTIIHNRDTKTSEILENYLDIIRSKDNKVDGEALDYVRETLKNLSFTAY